MYCKEEIELNCSASVRLPKLTQLYPRNLKLVQKTRVGIVTLVTLQRGDLGNSTLIIAFISEKGYTIGGIVVFGFVAAALANLNSLFAEVLPPSATFYITVFKTKMSGGLNLAFADCC